MLWQAKAFQVHKATNRKADQRDVVSLNLANGRVAVADAYTLGTSLGPWAKILAHGYTGVLDLTDLDDVDELGPLPTAGDPESLMAWLVPLHELWWRVATAGMTTEQQVAQLRRTIQLAGGGSTLVGLQLDGRPDGAWDWVSSGAGDSNLFIVRGDD